MLSLYFFMYIHILWLKSLKRNINAGVCLQFTLFMKINVYGVLACFFFQHNNVDKHTN